MGTKTLLFKELARWRLFALNQRLAVLYIPGLIMVLSILSLVFLSPNPTLHSQQLGSMVQLHIYNLVEGALLGLACFTILLAFHKENHFFLIVGTWILCNLHLSAQALGADSYWLQQQLPEAGVFYINQIVVGMYFVLSQQILQISLNVSPSSNIKNVLLGLLALIVFFTSFIPYAPLFNALLIVAVPVGLALAMWLSIQRLKPLRSKLLAWQNLLFFVLFSGLVTYLLSFVIPDSALLQRFNAVIFLILTNSIVILGIINRIKELRLSQNELRSNYQNSPFSVLKIDHSGTVLHTNRAFRRLCAKLSLPTPLVWNDLFPEQNWKNILKRTQTGKYTEIQLKANSPLKTQSPLFALHANTIPEGYVITLNDITLYVNNLNHLKTQVDNDSVTQILNQRGLEKALQHTFSNLSNYQPCFLAYLDVNHVNHVNRAHGHAAGDALLQEVSQRINEVLQQRHSLGRIDSDDFMFLLDKTTAQKAKQLAKEITSRLNNTIIKTYYRDYKLNVHLGLVEIGSNMDPQAAVRAAQGACLDALRRNIDVVLYQYNSKEMQDRIEELQLFEHLEKGITECLFVEMQPLMSLKNPLTNLKIEVLLRIRRKNGELIPLHTFIPAAEENGTISVMDKWVFSSTLEWMHKHQNELTHIRKVNINLSGYSLNNDKFINELFEILDSYKHLLQKLCVEITEGVALEDLHRSREIMLKLQDKGIQIALDDFGAGYTSFSYLRELPANSLKIDGALIQDMLSKDSNIAIVRTIVELARNLDMYCVAEWVEDIDTLAKLQKMGVDYAQGFVVSRPCSPDQILQAKDIRGLVKDPAVIKLIEQI